MKVIKTKKGRGVNGKTLIITADMGKDRHYRYWCGRIELMSNLLPCGTTARVFKSSGNVSHARKIQDLNDIVFGYESTGS